MGSPTETTQRRRRSVSRHISPPPPSIAPTGIGRRLYCVRGRDGSDGREPLLRPTLLHLIAHDLHTGAGTAGLFVTLSQVGYATGFC